jgi:hypothetical protein
MYRGIGMITSQKILIVRRGYHYCVTVRRMEQHPTP